MKKFEFQKLFLKPVNREIAQYWGDCFLVAEHLYSQLKGHPLKKKDIKKLWKETGPPTFLERLIFGPDYNRIQAHYKNIKYSLNKVQEEIDKKMAAIDEMLPEELEAENALIQQYNQENFKKIANLEIETLGKKDIIITDKEYEIENMTELFKKPKAKYKF